MVTWDEACLPKSAGVEHFKPEIVESGGNMQALVGTKSEKKKDKIWRRFLWALKSEIKEDKMWITWIHTYFNTG